uniref:Retrovirus-related Pol polyprotein from transposon TNT 1-94 n=1 Tax=Cajanus cajan TaxID=3821 RepID=A0A151T271_CAJCA|nr:hypothetical protein KK1_023571 [Cajanus cajan]
MIIQFKHDLHDIHLRAVKRARSVIDRRFTSRYCMFLGGHLESSSAEDEFRVMSHDMREGLWMKIILDDLKAKHEGSMNLFCNNKSTINIVITQSNMT